MDRQPGLSARAGAALAAAVVLAACGAPASSIVLPSGSRVLARGSLAYAVGFAGDDRVVSVELEERFALLVRTTDGRGLGRWDLGPAERDLVALAIGDEVAWVGGADRRVRGVGLTDGRPVATWPTGAAVTALALAPGGRLLVGDAEGGLCLRRLVDGALLQCVQLGDRALAEIVLAGDLVVVLGEGRRWGLTLPALGLVATPADPRRLHRRGRQLRQGDRVLLVLGGVVRAVAVDEHGRIAVAGWIARQGDPSLVLLPAPRP